MGRFRVAMLALGIGLAGCGGGGAKVESSQTAYGTTVGQELMDLENAKNQGLISEDEYDRQREAILERSKQ